MTDARDRELQFISEREVQDGVVRSSGSLRNKRIYRINELAFKTPGAYIKVYDLPDADIE